MLCHIFKKKIKIEICSKKFANKKSSIKHLRTKKVLKNKKKTPACSKLTFLSKIQSKIYKIL
jgi:hypothetical protein